MSETKKDLTKSQGTAVGAVQMFNQLVEEAGYTGHENVKATSIAIPFLRISQDLTKQAKEKNAEYIQGLKPGMLFNTASQKVFGEKAKVIVLDYFESFIEWKPKRGGFVRSYTPQEFEAKKASCTVNEKGVYITKEGNEIQDTRNYFVMFPDAIQEGIALFPLTGTGISHSRKWMSKIENTFLPAEVGKGKAPIYAAIWELELKDFTNDQGQWAQIGVQNKVGWVWENDETAKAVLEAVKVVKELRSKSSHIDYAESVDGATSSNTSSGDDEF
jgi:hypothetical protein